MYKLDVLKYLNFLGKEISFCGDKRKVVALASFPGDTHLSAMYEYPTGPMYTKQGWEGFGVVFLFTLPHITDSTEMDGMRTEALNKYN